MWKVQITVLYPCECFPPVCDITIHKRIAIYTYSSFPFVCLTRIQTQRIEKGYDILEFFKAKVFCLINTDSGEINITDLWKEIQHSCFFFKIIGSNGFVERPCSSPLLLYGTMRNVVSAIKLTFTLPFNFIANPPLVFLKLLIFLLQINSNNIRLKCNV